MPCNQPSGDKRKFQNQRAVKVQRQNASEREEMSLYRTGLNSRYSPDKWESTAKEQGWGSVGGRLLIGNALSKEEDSGWTSLMGYLLKEGRVSRHHLEESRR